MATTKKTEANTETKVAAAKTSKTAAKVTEEKKAPAKKAAAAKKAPAKKAATTKKATATKKAAATKVNVFVEFGGAQVSIDEVIKNVKLTYGKAAKEIAIYLKPDESKAYFVADGNESDMDVFFC